MLPPFRGGGKPSSFWQSACAECESVFDDFQNDLIGEWALPFELARACRGHPDEAKLNPIAVAVALYRHTVGPRTVYESEEDFVQPLSVAWRKVRVLPGENLLASAAEASARDPLSIRKDHDGEVTDGYRRFVSFCGHLCVAAGTDRIKLPCREVGEALGVRKDTVSSYRQQATDHGYLILLKKHRHNAGGKGEATLFRFRVEWWEKFFKGKVKASA